MQLCHSLKARSRFLLISSFRFGVFCPTESGPLSGDSHNRFGVTSFSLSSADLHPKGFDKSKSCEVQRSTLRFAFYALFVVCDVGSQNTSTKSVCLSSLCINMAISVFNCRCHFSFSFVNHLRACGGSDLFSSGAGSSFSCSSPVFRPRIANPVHLHKRNCIRRSERPLLSFCGYVLQSASAEGVFP